MQKLQAIFNTEMLIGLLAQKTEHLLVVSRYKLPNNIVISIRKEVKMIQAEIMRRRKEKGQGEK